MSDLIRLSMSIEKPLYERLERLVEQSGYTNRSEFVRDLVRQKLVETEWQGDRVVLGTVTLVYDHHQRGLSDRLTDLQHHHHNEVLAATHVHLSHDLCAEMILIRGKGHRIKHLVDQMRQQKGVLHAELSMTSTGTGLR